MTVIVDIPTAIAQIIIPTLIVNAGNWKSLFVALNPLMVEIAVASANQNATTPADKVKPRRKQRRRFPAA